MHWRRKWQPTPVFLPGESQGRGSLVGCCLWGRTESDRTEAKRLSSSRTVPTRVLCPCGFSRQEYWSGLPCPPPGDLLNPGIEPRSPGSQVDSLLSEPAGKPKNTGVDTLSLLQGIFVTQELDLRESSLLRRLERGREVGL